MPTQTNTPKMHHAFSRGRPPDTLFQTILSTDVPAPDRYEYWKGSQVRSIAVDPPSPEQKRDFQAKIVSLASLTKEMHYSFSDGFSGRRSHRAAKAAQDDDLALLFVAKGQLMAAFDTGDVAVESGGFYLYDSRLPQRLGVSRHALVQIDLPRSELETLFGGKTPSPALVAQALGQSRLTPLLRTHLTLFPRTAIGMTQGERQVMLETSEALALAILQGAVGGQLPTDSGRARTLQLAARQFIAHNLDRPDLSPDMICAGIGCSRATLYRVFKKNGLTVSGYIRELRLQRLHRMLCNPLDGRPIAVLAQYCGLIDPPNLSQMFRRRFGLCPRELREQRPG